jgi:hypothetical protein
MDKELLLKDVHSKCVILSSYHIFNYLFARVYFFWCDLKFKAFCQSKLCQQASCAKHEEKTPLAACEINLPERNLSTKKLYQV